MKSLTKLLVAFLFFSCGAANNIGQADKWTNSNPSAFPKRSDLRELSKRFGRFQYDSNSIYSIKLCADVPYNKNPAKVLFRKQPGHVFVILSQQPLQGETVSEVFGFYPIRPASVILFKNVKSQLRSNTDREYDAEVNMQVSSNTFFAILDSSLIFARKKYNLNRYNCYDYGLQLFNIAIPTNPIKSQYVKFPFIWGKGGSPTGLYHALRELKETDSIWAQRIRFGSLRAPH